jgi:hypothetical protein
MIVATRLPEFSPKERKVSEILDDKRRLQNYYLRHVRLRFNEMPLAPHGVPHDDWNKAWLLLILLPSASSLLQTTRTWHHDLL